MGLCGRDCDRCNLKLRCQGCSLCEMPLCENDCIRCFSLCPNRPGSFGYLKQIGGGRIRLESNKALGLPANIPVLPDRFTEMIHIRDIIGVHGGNMLSSNGENIARVYRTKGLQETLNLERPVKGVLQFYVKDRTLEGIWDKKENIISQLMEFPWAAVISPNFSVYEDAPRMDHLYNIKRSSIVYNEMIAAGLPAVPDISWYNRIDLDQWIREINNNSLKCIAFSMQTVGIGSRASNTYLNYLIGFKYLTDRISSDVEIILAGVASPVRVQLLQKLCKNRISILNQAAYVHSRRGVLSATGKTAAGNISKNGLMMKNIDFYDRAYIEKFEEERSCQNQEIAEA
ncbi:MAG: DUF4417 domain-containing protein [Eubacteriales bacterium]|nr:DUF4417 domain-containing protein [Eubacteriales bacterium]